MNYCTTCNRVEGIGTSATKKVSAPYRCEACGYPNAAQNRHWCPCDQENLIAEVGAPTFNCTHCGGIEAPSLGYYREMHRLLLN